MFKALFRKLKQQKLDDVIGIDNVLVKADDPQMLVDDNAFDGADDLDGGIKGVIITIKYSDADGDVTERPIRLTRFHNYTYSECLISYCLLRQAPRAFRTDRIVEIIEHNSGEVFERPEDYLKKLRMWAGHEQGKFLNEVSNSHKQLMVRVREGVRILIFIARSDGFYHPEEEQAIAMFIDDRSFLKTDKKQLEYDLDVILDWAKRLHVRYDEIERGLEKLITDKGLLRNLHKAMMSVAVADGVVVSDEIQAIERVMLTALEV